MIKTEWKEFLRQMENKKNAALCLFFALNAALTACGKKDDSNLNGKTVYTYTKTDDQGRVTSKGTYTKTTPSADHVMDGSYEEAQIDTFNADGTMKSTIEGTWKDPNSLQVFSTCSAAASETAKDSLGRSWGYENGKTCKISGS